MRKTNPVLAGVAALALTATLVPAFAMASETNTKTTDVKYKVTEGYEWSVPSEIDFGQDKGVNKTSTVKADGTTDKTQKVKVTKNVIEEGKRLSITAAGSGAEGAFQVKTGSNTTLNYTVSTGDTQTTSISPNGEVLTVNAGTNEGEQALTFTLSTSNGTSEVAGDYTGTVKYTATIKDQD